MSEERGKTMTNVNRIVAESNKVVRYINGNSIAEVYAKQEAHSAGVYISLTGIPEAICVARFNYGMKETSSVAITMQAAKLMAEIIFLFSAGGSSAVQKNCPTSCCRKWYMKSRRTAFLLMMKQILCIL